MRPVWLFDASWMVLDHPRQVAPTFDTIRSAGYWYPGSDTVTCQGGHTWRTRPDRHGRAELPDEIEQKYRGEVFDPDMNDTYPVDPYWVCGVCGAEVDISWRHTGEMEFAIQSGEELWPSDEVTLRLLDGAPTVHTVLSGTYPLQGPDGEPVCEVAPDEWGYDSGLGGGTVTVVARIVGEPRESLTALLRAVYGAEVPE